MVTWSYSSMYFLYRYEMGMSIGVNFRPQLLSYRGKGLRYPLDRRLDGPRSRSGSCGEEKISYPCRKSNPNSLLIQPSIVTIQADCLGYPPRYHSNNVFLRSTNYEVHYRAVPSNLLLLPPSQVQHPFQTTSSCVLPVR
jgi:hypothetical protein